MSSSSHPAANEFLWYVQSGLRLALQDWPSLRVQEFEEHVSICDSCAAQLCSEAQGQLVLEELARKKPAPAQRGGTQRGDKTWAYIAVATMLVLLVVGIRGASSQPASSQSNVFVPPLDAGLLLADGDSSPYHLGP